MIGGFIAPVIRRITPRAALLGSLAGISLTFISLSPGAQIFMTPVIGVTCLAVILASWLGSYRYPGGIPGGLMALLAGSLIAWGGHQVGFELGGTGPDQVGGAVDDVGVTHPYPAVTAVLGVCQDLVVCLVTAHPLSISLPCRDLENFQKD